MNEAVRQDTPLVTQTTCKSIDWYAEGQGRLVQIGNIEIAIRLIARKGRRARIAISAPVGAIFNDQDLSENVRMVERFT